MPTLICHGISGIALNRLLPASPCAARIFLLCLFCSIAPDLDAIGFRLGVPYHHWLGHRGFSHSLLFAAILALTATLLIPMGGKFLKTGFLLFAAFFSCSLLHDVLDAMTNGGLGVAFLSPFSYKRFFLPWRPIVVSPMSLKVLFSSRGLPVMASEFIWVIAPSLFITAIAHLYKRKYSIQRYYKDISISSAD